MSFTDNNKNSKMEANKSVADNPRLVMQKTLKSAINCTGVALHSGEKVTMTLKPAPVDSGIVFKRIDIAGKGAEIKATWDNVVDTRMNTTIGNADGVTVATIEHLMAALAGSGINNALIEITGPEVPVMDGSSAPFVFLIECAGVEVQNAPVKVIRIKKRLELDEENIHVAFSPDNKFSISCEINFENTVIAHQALDVGLMNGTFKKEICRARTFGFLHQAEQLRAAGLAKGASLDNAVVFNGNEVMNEDGLRYEDECVRHKVLDAVGDLSLAGHPIIGHFTGIRSGHATNNKLLRLLFANQDAWSLDVISEDELAEQGAGGVWMKDADMKVAVAASV